MTMIFEKWEYTSDSTDGIYWKNYVKRFSLNEHNYAIGLYQENNGLWQILFVEPLEQIYMSMFGNSSQSQFSSYEEARQQADSFLRKLQVLKSFL